jgi:hypothetical protein
MFDSFKKVFSKTAKEPAESVSPSAHQPSSQVSQWAEAQGLAYSGQSRSKTFALDGKVGGKPWRLELGSPQRKFIQGEELRARAELGIDENISVLIMSRALKNALEKKAYDIYTDGLQTTVDPNLPQEMRWLAMYEELAWESLPLPFWDRYAVLSDDRGEASSWVQPDLANLLINWPEPAPHAEVPIILMLLHGKAYLRMEYTPADISTLQHAEHIFTRACELALNGPGAGIAP